MKIILNGQNRELTEAISLNRLIDQVSGENKRVIAEINGQIIKKDQWNDTHINDGDSIELVTFVGGGWPAYSLELKELWLPNSTLYALSPTQAYANNNTKHITGHPFRNRR